MNKPVVHLRELLENMLFKQQFLDLRTGEYIHPIIMRCREEDFVELVPVSKRLTEKLCGGPITGKCYKHPEEELYYVVPGKYLQNNTSVKLPIPFPQTFILELHFREDDLKDLVPASDWWVKQFSPIAYDDQIAGRLYKNPKTGLYYSIPDIYFQKGTLDNVIPVPGYSECETVIAVAFLNSIIDRYSDNEEILAEIKRLLALADNPESFGYPADIEKHFFHEFDVFIMYYVGGMPEEYRRYTHAERRKIAIKWCEDNGLEYIPDDEIECPSPLSPEDKRARFEKMLEENRADIEKRTAYAKKLRDDELKEASSSTCITLLGKYY